MSKFEQLHADVLRVYPDCKSYRSLSITGRIVEAWEKDDDDVWHDVTLREQELDRVKRELAAALREHNKLTEEQDEVHSEANNQG